LKDLTFQYEGASVPVIDNLNLEIKRNQFVAFVGSTGSGKSTIIDIILGLHSPGKGGLVLDGVPIENDQLRKWRAGIGYVPQEIFLLDDTVAANIAFGVEPKDIDMEQVKRVAEVAQIKEFIETEMPDGFLSEVGERGVRLSGGQRQRIGLARALYHQPSLLVLDEATSALDMKTEAALMRAIEGLYGKITLVVIAHRLSTIRRADNIFRLDHGQVADQGTFEELGLQA
jgi:ATP-binding cassette subfamily C protein